jgi:hypothetical protein
MDPSEIVKVPYDIKRLSVFTMVPIVTLLFVAMWDAPTKLTSFMLTLFRLTIVVFGVLGLCGANLGTNPQHSMYTAIYAAALLTTTINPSNAASSKVQEQLPFADKSDAINFFRLYGVLLTTIALQILQVLDWGVQVQRWPLPIILGVTYGYVVGTLFGIMASYVQKTPAKKQKK